MNSIFFQNMLKLLVISQYHLMLGYYNSNSVYNKDYFAGAAKQTGSILSFVYLIRLDFQGADMEIGTILSTFEVISRNYIKNKNIRSAVCVFILIGNTEEISDSIFTKSDIRFSIDECPSKVLWAVDTQLSKLVCPDGMPDKINGIEALVKRSFSSNNNNYEKYIANEITALKKRPVITTAIILINIFVFIAMTLDGGTTDVNNLIAYGAIEPERIFSYGEYYRLLSAMFIHIGFYHLLTNCCSLYIVGTRVEKYMGIWAYILIYFVSGICGSVMSLFLTNSVAAGASGAICGLFSAVLLYTIFNKKSMAGFDFYSAAAIIAINIGAGFLIPQIDNFGHIGGFLGGLLSCGIYYSIKRRKNDVG